jgi:hypothetical protein
LLIVPSWNASSRSLLPTKQERQLMKKIALALTLLVIALGWPSRAQLVTNANNISFWVGSGTNWSVLVLDFKDGGPKQAFAWGYRYNNPAPSGAAMLLAIDAADPNLDLVYSGNAKTNLFLTRIDSGPRMAGIGDTKSRAELFMSQLRWRKSISMSLGQPVVRRRQLSG